MTDYSKQKTQKVFLSLCLCFIFFINIIVICYGNEWKNDRYYVDDWSVSASNERDISKDDIHTDIGGSLYFTFNWLTEDIEEFEKIRFKVSMNTFTATANISVRFVIRVYRDSRDSKRETIADFISNTTCFESAKFSESFDFDELKTYIDESDKTNRICFKISVSLPYNVSDEFGNSISQYSIGTPKLILIPPKPKNVEPLNPLMIVGVIITLIGFSFFVLWLMVKSANKNVAPYIQKPKIYPFGQPIGKTLTSVSKPKQKLDIQIQNPKVIKCDYCGNYYIGEYCVLCGSNWKII